MLLSEAPEVSNYDPQVRQTCIEVTCAATRHLDERYERVNTAQGIAMAVSFAVLGIVACVLFAEYAADPPRLDADWLFALVVIPLIVIDLIAVGGTAWLSVMMARPNFRHERRGVFSPLLLGLQVPVAWALTVLLSWFLWSRWPPWGAKELWVALGLTIGAITGAFALAVLSTVLIERVIGADLRDQLTVGLADALAIATLGCVLRSDKTWAGAGAVPAWRLHPRARRDFSRKLLDIAKYVESDAARLAPRGSHEVRESLQSFGRSVAAGLTNCARVVALGGHDDRVVQGLADAWVAACEHRWSDLATVEPPPRRQRLARMIAERAAVIGMLAAVGLVIVPLVLPPDVQTQARSALLGAAILAATTPRAALIEARDGLRKLIH